MKLVEFQEQTVVIAKDQPEYLPLPAYRFADDPQGRIICCWQLTWRERLAVLLGGKLWHQVLTFNHPLQPQLVTVEKPEMPSASVQNTEVSDGGPLTTESKQARTRRSLH